MAAPPFFFTDLDGNPALSGPASYVVSGRTYRFPPGHRLAGVQTRATMEPMRRDLFRLLVRVNYDRGAFMSLLSHGIQELVLPFSSAQVKMTGAWLYPNGTFHAGLDFNDEPRQDYPYPDHPARTNFRVLAAADGTVVGWDETKLLTLEHFSQDGQLYRTVYNMMRDVPVAPASSGVIQLGGAVAAGQPIGEVWDPPGNPIHLHFGMAIPHDVPPGWAPDLGPLFAELSSQFEVDFTPAQEQDILANLNSRQWRATEWFFVDPFGRYDISRSSNASYGPLGRGFYFPVPAGPGTYSFRDEAITGDPGGDRIPLFAAPAQLLDSSPAGPLSLAAFAAASE